MQPERSLLFFYEAETNFPHTYKKSNNKKTVTHSHIFFLYLKGVLRFYLWGCVCVCVCLNWPVENFQPSNKNRREAFFKPEQSTLKGWHWIILSNKSYHHPPSHWHLACMYNLEIPRFRYKFEDFNLPGRKWSPTSNCLIGTSGRGHNSLSLRCLLWVCIWWSNIKGALFFREHMSRWIMKTWNLGISNWHFVAPTWKNKNLNQCTWLNPQKTTKKI